MGNKVTTKQLVQAVELNDAEKLRKLMFHDTYDVHLLNIADKKNPRTPLMCACSQNNVELVRVLIDAGCSLDVRDVLQKKTALHYACQKGYDTILKMLIDKGASLNVVDNVGSTALIYSSEYSHLECVKLLCEAGADATIKNNRQRNALNYAQTEDIHRIINKAAGGEAHIVDQLGNITNMFAAIKKE